MIAAALFYYQRNWWHNRLLMRVRRLRQPKYLFGAIVGGFYFYWYIFRALGRGGSGAPVSMEHQDLVETIGSLVLLVMVVLAWLVPHARAALHFTEAEVAFLFPAPISRRTLIHFKLLKSQAVILFSAVFMTFIGRSWGRGGFFVRLFGWWVVFATLNLHLLGSSFAVTRLMDRGLSNWLRRILVLSVVGVTAAVILVWVWQTVPPLPQHVAGAMDFGWVSHYAGQILHSGPLPYVLYPFRLVVAPYFALDARHFLMALGPALAIMGLHYWWVMRSNVAFEEASVELSRKTAERISAMRSGDWQSARKPSKARRPPFKMRPVGRPAIALFWKNLISAGNLVTTRFWFFLVWLAVFGGLMLQSMTRAAGGLSAGIGFLALALAGLSLVWGPQMLRNDLRQDMPATDILKMFPMPGWEVVLGQVLAPTVILAGAQWILLLLGLLLFPNHFGPRFFPWTDRISVALGAGILLPSVDLIAMLIPNAAVLFLPAWFELGKEMPRGFETMGQRLILLFGQLFVLIVSMAPALVAFWVVFYLTSRVLPFWACVPPGAILAAAFLLAEGALGIKLMGGVFDRFDLSEEVLHQD